MKIIVFYISLIGLLIQCQSQDKKLFDQTPITDFSTYSFYNNLTEIKNNETVWKKSYSYIDSIAISKITYESDGLQIKGFCVKPKKEGKYPVIIFNRGGSYEFGALTVRMVTLWLGALANKGYVVLCSQYRGNGGSEGKEEFGGSDVNDVLNLIEVADEIKFADTKKIGMYGWSRGGMMTYLTLPKTNRIKAAVVGGAVSNFKALIKDRPAFANMIPNSNENNDEELDKRSAILWVDKFSKEVPILMLHGTSDWRVKPEQSLTMALEFEKYRIPYRLIMFEGGDHGISEHISEVDEQIFKWFDKYLKQDALLPNMEYHGK